MFKIYRNLNIGKKSNNRWSISKKDNRVKHAISIYSTNVTIKQPSGKAFLNCLNGGGRSVFAWFKSNNINTDKLQPIPKNAKRINFNPKSGDKYFHILGEQVDFIKEVWLTKEGECYGIK